MVRARAYDWNARILRRILPWQNAALTDDSARPGVIVHVLMHVYLTPLPLGSLSGNPATFVTGNGLCLQEAGDVDLTPKGWSDVVANCALAQSRDWLRRRVRRGVNALWGGARCGNSKSMRCGAAHTVATQSGGMWCHVA
jgi:hypothetical protein